MITEAQIAELERLATAASKGPWTSDYDNSDSGQWMVVLPIGARISYGWHSDNTQPKADADFIAACRDGVPDLIEALRDARNAWRALADEARGIERVVNVTNIPPGRQVTETNVSSDRRLRRRSYTMDESGKPVGGYPPWEDLGPAPPNTSGTTRLIDLTIPPNTDPQGWPFGCGVKREGCMGRAEPCDDCIPF